MIGLKWEGFDYEYVESLEKGLHWSMDVGFREDRQVAQRTNLAENLAVIRGIAFNHLKQEKSLLSIEKKGLRQRCPLIFWRKY